MKGSAPASAPVNAADPSRPLCVWGGGGAVANPTPPRLPLPPVKLSRRISDNSVPKCAGADAGGVLAGTAPNLAVAQRRTRRRWPNMRRRAREGRVAASESEHCLPVRATRIARAAAGPRKRSVAGCAGGGGGGAGGGGAAAGLGAVGGGGVGRQHALGPLAELQCVATPAPRPTSESSYPSHPYPSHRCPSQPLLCVARRSPSRPIWSPALSPASESPAFKSPRIRVIRVPRCGAARFSRTARVARGPYPKPLTSPALRSAAAFDHSRCPTAAPPLYSGGASACF